MKAPLFLLVVLSLLLTACGGPGLAAAALPQPTQIIITTSNPAPGPGEGLSKVVPNDFCMVNLSATPTWSEAAAAIEAAGCGTFNKFSLLQEMRRRGTPALHEGENQVFLPSWIWQAADSTIFFLESPLAADTFAACETGRFSVLADGTVIDWCTELANAEIGTVAVLPANGVFALSAKTVVNNSHAIIGVINKGEALLVAQTALAADSLVSNNQFDTTGTTVWTMDVSGLLGPNVLDIAENGIHVLEGDRVTMRLSQATVLWPQPPRFERCWQRPRTEDHDEAYLIEFPTGTKWGSATYFLYNATNPLRSTFISGEINTPAQGFTQEVPCNDKRISGAYAFLKNLLETLEDLGHIPLWPE